MKTVYLRDIPLPEAQARWERALCSIGGWGILGEEYILLDEHALGRVLARPIWANISSPHYHSAAMDGFAIRAMNTTGAMPTNPRTLFYGSQALYVDTGDPIPEWADAVIPIENVEAIDENERPSADVRCPHAIRIRIAVTPWSHIRSMGEDIVATQLVLPAGHILRPVDLGAIAACGHDGVWVARKPRVAILPTGSELVPIGRSVRPGEIIEFNSLVLAAQVNAWGGEAIRFPITCDEFEEIKEKVQQACLQGVDLILLNAGSSAGSEDFSAQVVESLGELLVHGVAVRPGHPVILGIVSAPQREEKEGIDQSEEVRLSSQGIPIIGVPGYPVSAALTGEIFVEPLLARWLGRKPQELPTLKARLTRKITSPAGDDDYVRVAVGRVGEQYLAAPLARGAGVITSLVRADGLAVLPRGLQGLPAGAEVTVHLYRSLTNIDKTILAIGSHDITLDLMAQFLAARDRGLSSANVGSLAGLIALQRREAHLAGSHLLDAETGEYNLSYVRRYLADIPVRIIALVGRKQGLLVPRGNPKQIQSLLDLARSDVFFINRQRGAGTRVLLDYHLNLLGIDSTKIQGYEREEFTHLAVAAAVASGRADCGLGIAAAAQALNLDFIPLFDERYDLVIPLEQCQNPLLAPLFEVLEDPHFRQTVGAMPGYDPSVMGKLIAEIG